jgi:hypothetical protein
MVLKEEERGEGDGKRKKEYGCMLLVLWSCVVSRLKSLSAVRHN